MERMLRILAFDTLSAGLYALLVGVQYGWTRLASTFVISWIYSLVIGTVAQLILPWLGRRLAGRSRAVFWVGMVAGLVVIAIPGALLAGALAFAMGLFGRTSPWAAVRSGVIVSLVIVLSVGVVISLYETTRAGLDAARESLRARELEIERAHRLATDARLASLESRLHPHFLFNAIAAIAGQVRDSPERAERLLVEFSDLLRASLDSTQRHTVPLADEVAVVRAYLEIEQARLGDRLRAKIDVPDQLAGWPVPPFALHTLVQNSVKHVAAARAAGGEVRVEATRAGELLRLSVWDDGPGFDLAIAPPGHGLDTLSERLEALFGVEARLDAAREDGGSRVTMSLPARLAMEVGE